MKKLILMAAMPLFASCVSSSDGLDTLKIEEIEAKVTVVSVSEGKFSGVTATFVHDDIRHFMHDGSNYQQYALEPGDTLTMPVKLVYSREEASCGCQNPGVVIKAEEPDFSAFQKVK